MLVKFMYACEIHVCMKGLTYTVCINVIADRKDADVNLLVGGNSNLGIETNLSSNVEEVGAGQHTLHV
jgi:hypothetical protein